MNINIKIWFTLYLFLLVGASLVESKTNTNSIIWQKIDSPAGGEIECLLESRDNYLLAGVKYKGLYLKTDINQPWKCITNQFSNPVFNRIFISEFNEKIFMIYKSSYEYYITYTSD